MSIICENFCSSDKGLELFKTIFGKKFIEAFYAPNTPNPAFIAPDVDGQISLVSIMASNISMAALFIVGVIFFSGVIKWIFDSANDGEALGKKSSALGSVARPIFAVLMLMPTASKFAVINIITLYFALWGHGFANKAYSQLIVGSFDTGVLQLAESDDALNRASDVSGAVFAGAFSQYCASYASENYRTSFIPPTFNSSGGMNAGGNTPFETVMKDKASFGRMFVDPNEGYVSGKVKVAEKITHGWIESGEMNLASSGPICGEVTFTKDLNPFPQDFATTSTDRPSWAARRLGYFTAKLNADMSEAKYKAAQQAYASGMYIALGQPNQLPAGVASVLSGSGIEVKGWATNLDLGRAEAELNPDVQSPAPNDQPNGTAGLVIGDNQTMPNHKGLILAANYLSSNLKIELREVLGRNGFTMSQAGGGVVGQPLNCGNSSGNFNNSQNEATGRQPSGVYESTMCEFLSEVYAGGWINAAPARQKIKQYKMSAGQNLLNPAVTYTDPSYLVTSGDDEAQASSASIFQSAISSVRKSATESKDPLLPVNSSVYSDSISDGAFSGSANSANAVTDKLQAGVTGMMFSLERSVLEFATGTGDDDVDTLTRMQDFGVGLGYATTAYNSFVFTFNKAAASADVLCALTPGIIKKLAIDCESMTNAAKFGFSVLFQGPLENAVRMLTVVAAYFAVFIPTMPFVFLLMAAIGWFIQVFQTLVGMPLWAIMHSIPGGDFIGGQQHGYFALVSLFFRPLIIVAGFFLAFELYDPIITLLVQGYFDMHLAIIISNSNHGFFAGLEMIFTWALHLLVLANLILGATYLVFGLIQELSDTTLEFMGTRVFAGFGNQETKSVAQGASGAFSQSNNIASANARQAKRDAKAGAEKDADRSADRLKSGSTDLKTPSNANADTSATGSSGNGGTAADDVGGGGGGGFGGGGGGGFGGGGSATGSSYASPFEIQREEGYNPNNTSSVISGVSDTNAIAAVAAMDKKDTFGRGKANKAARRGAQEGFSETEGGFGAKVMGGIRGGLQARSEFKADATAGHNERMAELKKSGSRGYNAMYHKHAQEGVAGVSMANHDKSNLSTQRRFSGENGAQDQAGFNSAIDQAAQDANMLPSRSERMAGSARP